MLIDSHCHLCYDKFDEDRAEVLARAHEAGITTIINPSTDLEDSRVVVAFAERNPTVFAAIGYHPNDASKFADDSIAQLRELAQHPKVVSIGEIGLDYYWDYATPEDQRYAFEEQLTLAREIDLPVIIHQRKSAADTMAVLRKWVAEGNGQHPGLVLHAFSGDVAQAEEAVDLGFHIGIGGPVTFKNSRHLPDVVRTVPSDRLLVETDAPFLSPHPFRGKRNEPMRVKLVAEKVASLKETPFEAMARQLTENTIRLFRLNR